MNFDVIEAFIFDLDGVILDSEPIHLAVSNLLLPDTIDPVSWENYERFIGKKDVHYFSYLKEYAQFSESVETLVSRYKVKLDHYFRGQEDLPIIPGIEDLIRQIAASGRKLAIASSSSHVNIKHVLDAAKLGQFFPIQVSGEDVENGKPAPDIYLEAARRLNVKTNQTVAVEDSEPGVQSALAAGLYTIGFTNPGSGKQDLSRAHAIIDRMPDLTLALSKADR